LYYTVTTPPSFNQETQKISAHAPRDFYLKRIYKKDGKLILLSVAAGALAFLASWIISTAATSVAPSPLANASIGVLISLLTYSASFFVFYVWYSARQESGGVRGLTKAKLVRYLIFCFKTVSLKELFEQSLRFLLHIVLMSFGFIPVIASPIAQLFAGGLGHLSIPIFANLAIFLRQRRLKKLAMKK